METTNRTRAYFDAVSQMVEPIHPPLAALLADPDADLEATVEGWSDEECAAAELLGSAAGGVLMKRLRARKEGDDVEVLEAMLASLEGWTRVLGAVLAKQMTEN